MSHEQARQRLEEIASDSKKAYKIDYAWKGDRLQFKRSGVTGHIDLQDDLVDLSIKLGMLLTPMKASIQKTIKRDIAGKLSDGKKLRLA